MAGKLQQQQQGQEEAGPAAKTPKPSREEPGPERRLAAVRALGRLRRADAGEINEKS